MWGHFDINFNKPRLTVKEWMQSDNITYFKIFWCSFTTKSNYCLCTIAVNWSRFFSRYLTTRGGVEDTKLEAKAKDTKKIRGQGQGQPFRGQTLSRPRTGMLEAKDQRHSRKCFPKKRSSKKFFRQTQFIGEARIFDWGGLNHKSHAMKSSKICLLALNQDFKRGEGLN